MTYDREVVVKGNPPSGATFANGRRLIQDREALEAALHRAVSPTDRRRSEQQCLMMLLRLRALDGLRLRPEFSASTPRQGLLAELMQYTQVSLVPKRRAKYEADTLAAGQSSHVFVTSGQSGRYVRSVGWWRDPLWGRLLVPMRP